jgi:7,8-dihydroneopterin aldolase/epimerase/oxygenase
MIYNNAACQFQCMSLNNLRFLAKIGCTEQERALPQYVRFDVQIRFPSLPTGCISDDIKDTVCYFNTAQRIGDICNRSEFKLIERLAWEVFSELKEFMASELIVGVRVTKERPPVPGLEGGASFCLGQWAEWPHQ